MAKTNGKVKFFKVNTDNHPELAEQFNVSTIPRVVFIGGGETSDEAGLASESEYQSMIDEIL